MAAAREYELVLMLDPARDAPARDSLAQEAKGMIEGGGTLKNENDWGLRKMAYEINRQNEADYRWFRFEGSNELLEQLDHNLKIADGVMRFRVFKVDPDAPVMVPPSTAAPAPGRDRGDRGDRERPSAPPAPAAPAPPAAEPSAAEPAAPAEPAAAEPAATEETPAAAEPAVTEETPAAAEAEPTPAPADPAPAAAEADSGDDSAADPAE